MSEPSINPGPIIVARHHITHVRHLENFENWATQVHIPKWLKAQPGISIRRYRSEKHEPYYYMTFYDFPAGSGVAGLTGLAREIRADWGEWGPNMRNYTLELYEPVWSAGRPPRGDATHPTIISRYSVEPEKEAEFNHWSDTEDNFEYVRDLPVANIRRYRTVSGDPPFQVQIQEYDSEAEMRATVKGNEPATRPKYWEAWARWMPYVNSLTRLVFNPMDKG